MASLPLYLQSFLIHYCPLIEKKHTMWKVYYIKMVYFFFYFTFCKRGILYVSLWRVALESAIAISLILEHYKTHSFLLFTTINNRLFLFHKICTVWRVNDLVHSVKDLNQGAVYFFFLIPIPKCFRIRVITYKNISEGENALKEAFLITIFSGSLTF